MTHHKHDSHYHPHGSDDSSEFAIQTHTSTVITKAQREHMIAEAAYYIAEQGRFQSGDPVRDWFQAQVEIDSKIKNLSH